MIYNATTTLNEIGQCDPGPDVWRDILRHFGKTEADDEPLHLLTIWQSNGFDDAKWCMRHVPSLKPLCDAFKAWLSKNPMPHEPEATFEIVCGTLVFPPVSDAYQAHQLAQAAQLRVIIGAAP